MNIQENGLLLCALEHLSAIINISFLEAKYVLDLKFEVMGNSPHLDLYATYSIKILKDSIRSNSKISDIPSLSPGNQRLSLIDRILQFQKKIAIQSIYGQCDGLKISPEHRQTVTRCLFVFNYHSIRIRVTYIFAYAMIIFKAKSNVCTFWKYIYLHIFC